jgi:hypothetical protein
LNSLADHKIGEGLVVQKYWVAMKSGTSDQNKNSDLMTIATKIVCFFKRTTNMQRKALNYGAINLRLIIPRDEEQGASATRDS